jgi:hypothetical protein
MQGLLESAGHLFHGVNHQSVATDQVLQEGGCASFTLTKIEETQGVE